ncbi:MAG: SapB/AmfS family lanthipeptide [Pseudonocardiaceae bacterium]
MPILDLQGMELDEQVSAYVPYRSTLTVLGCTPSPTSNISILICR